MSWSASIIGCWRLVITAVILCTALYRYVAPILAEVAVTVTLPTVATLISKNVLASLGRAIFEPNKLSTECQRTLNDGFSELIAPTPQGESKHPAYTLNFCAGGAIGSNAFTLQDGTVVSTDKLVELAGKDDKLILDGLNQKVFHVNHEHSLRQILSRGRHNRAELC